MPATVVRQTRRHTNIAALLGIEHVVACVNKMDLDGRYWAAVTQAWTKPSFSTTGGASVNG
jgi:sulfate adenylyltransferase subunit 1 (EFTu-like GTPase family)